ncbi:hypothetical protein B566_EDAN013759 [Ephemera danica]|nr:hypothetical protein B566_EDAN013759 [Ephemera danica]
MVRTTKNRDATDRGLALHLFVFLVLMPLMALAATNTTRRPGELNKPLWNATWTDRLKRDLMLSSLTEKGYDKFARPAQHTNTTVVTIDLNLKHIDLFWVDEKLKWNASDYGGLSRLHLADHEVWQPDIVLYNSASGSEVDHYGNTHCIVHEDGTVLWVPPSQFRVFCDIDLRRWPYDEQTCTLRLGSWTYDGDQVDLQVDDNDAGIAETDWMVNNSEWELLEMTKQRNVAFYACCVEAYIDVSYTLTLRRRSPAYSAIVITPATVVVLLTLAGFWLPPHAGEKVILNAFTTLITLILLLSFSTKLPAMASHTPLIVVFYSSSLVLVTLALLVSIAVINIARYPRRTPLPWPLRHALTGWLGRVLCLGVTSLHHVSLGGGGSTSGEELREAGDDTAGVGEDQLHIISGASSTSTQLDWLLLATAIDRFAFGLYCIVFAILAAAYV